MFTRKIHKPEAAQKYKNKKTQKKISVLCDQNHTKSLT